MLPECSLEYCTGPTGRGVKREFRESESRTRKASRPKLRMEYAFNIASGERGSEPKQDIMDREVTSSQRVRPPTCQYQSKRCPRL